MKGLNTRLTAVEAAAGVHDRDEPRRRFVCSGPVGFDAVAFLRSRGRVVGPRDVVRVIVRTNEGRIVDAPLADLTDAVWGQGAAQ